MAVRTLLARLGVAITRFDAAISTIFSRRFPPDAVCVLGVQSEPARTAAAPFSLRDLVGDGFLWAVPKSRRTIEKRLKRKFGDPKYVMKILLPKTNIRTCSTCGGDHLAGCLCPNCYKKVMDETKAMQDKIQEELKLSPVENEVAVVYEGEKAEKPDEFWKGKRIVEMEKPRPKWFSKNLMQQTTQQPATTKDVKPTDLG